MFNGICEAITRELEHLDEKYAVGTQLSGQDLEHIDKMAHALKSLATYGAMKGESGYEGSYEGSYARGRSRTTGRYVSRDDRYPEGSYDRRY